MTQLFAHTSSHSIEDIGSITQVYEDNNQRCSLRKENQENANRNDGNMTHESERCALGLLLTTQLETGATLSK